MKEKLKTTKIITANNTPDKSIISKIPLEYTHHQVTIPPGKMPAYMRRFAQKRVLPRKGLRGGERRKVDRKGLRKGRGKEDTVPLLSYSLAVHMQGMNEADECLS